MEQDKTYTSEWMANQVVENLKMTDELEILKFEFFEEMTTHRFTESRLLWLYQWVKTGGNCDEKINFLREIWSLEYFHPFATPLETSKMIEDYYNQGFRNRYTVSLSSTFPGMIRITFFSLIRNGIVHKRFPIGNEYNESITEPISYKVFLMEDEIFKIIKSNTTGLIHKPIKYVVPKDEMEVKPQPYSDCN